MTDEFLTFLCVALEIGLIVLVVSLYSRKTYTRQKLRPVLGICISWAVFYIWVTYGYLLGSHTGSEWPFNAVWVMTAIPFLGSVVCSIVVSMFVKNTFFSWFLFIFCALSIPVFTVWFS